MNRSLMSAAFMAIWGIVTSAWAQQSPPEGFESLFNGLDLTGWVGRTGDPPAVAAMSTTERAAAQAHADELMRQHWTVQEGILHFDGGGDSLCTAESYRNFELLVDWRIQAGGDSGIYLRESPQVQIWDNPIGSGGLYNNQQNPSGPLWVADKPAGEWNTFRIRLIGDRATVYLNTIPVVIDTPLENYWDRTKPLESKGRIELQAHGNPLEFRNIFIRALPDDLTGGTVATRPAVHPGDVVAVVGDSITEQRLYSRFVEEYLLACSGIGGVRVIQFGWGGETAVGFLSRMTNDLLPFGPDVVTTCYGMNDGAYRAFTPAIGQGYGSPMRQIVDRLKMAGATVIVGSPGVVDLTTFKGPNRDPIVYNDNLGHLRDIAQQIAAEAGMPFANVHDTMMATMLRAKKTLGEAYHVAGGDGVHPAGNGHLVMAHAFLKAMGLGGREIARIVIDMTGKAQVAGPGQQVIDGGPGFADIASGQWPFVILEGERPSAFSPRTIVPYVPFNEELNQFRLVVLNLHSAQAKVRWNSFERTFGSDQLAAGINLAAEFPENPFAGVFTKLDAAVRRKQEFETRMIKACLTHLRSFEQTLGPNENAQAAYAMLRREFAEKWEEECRNVEQSIAPVRHRIEVIPVP